MAYRLTIKPPVLFASWHGFVAQELKEVADHIGALRRSTGAPVAYLSCTPASTRALSDEEGGAMLAFLQSILPDCATIHLVLEGDSFAKSEHLAIVSKHTSATLRARDIHMYATLEEGLRSVWRLYGVDLSDPASPLDAPPERASGAFRHAAEIVDGGARVPPRKG
jgi:hypothetical protein